MGCRVYFSSTHHSYNLLYAFFVSFALWLCMRWNVWQYFMQKKTYCLCTFLSNFSLDILFFCADGVSLTGFLCYGMAFDVPTPKNVILVLHTFISFLNLVYWTNYWSIFFCIHVTPKHIHLSVNKKVWQFTSYKTTWHYQSNLYLRLSQKEKKNILSLYFFHNIPIYTTAIYNVR